MIGGKITKRQKNQDGQEDISTVINPKARKVFGTPQAEINELQAEMNKMANEMKGLFKKYGKCIKSFPIHGQNFLTLTFATCKIVTLSSLSYSQ